MERYYRFGRTIDGIRKDNNVKILALIDGIMSRTEYFRYSKNEVDISFEHFAELLIRLNVSYQDTVMWAKKIDDSFLVPSYSSSINVAAMVLQPYEQVKGVLTNVLASMKADLNDYNTKNQRMRYLTVILLIDQYINAGNDVVELSAAELLEMLQPHVSIENAIEYVISNTAWDYVELELVRLLVKYMTLETMVFFINKLAINVVHQNNHFSDIWYDMILQETMEQAHNQNNDELMIMIARKRVTIYDKQLKNSGYAAFAIKEAEIIAQTNKGGRQYRQLMSAFELNQKRLPTIGTGKFIATMFMGQGK